MTRRKGIPSRTTAGGLMLLATVFLVRSAVAATALDAFDRIVGRSATNDSDRPKATCICQDGGPFDDFAGVLIRFPGFFSSGNKFLETVVVECLVLAFDDTGSRSIPDSKECRTFVPLPR